MLLLLNKLRNLTRFIVYHFIGPGSHNYVPYLFTLVVRNWRYLEWLAYIPIIYSQ